MSGLLDRRSVLARLWRWGVGLIGVAAAWTSWDVLRPISPVGFGGKVKAGLVDQIPSDDVVYVAPARSYLTRVDDEVIAIWSRCPHLGCNVPWCESSGQFECGCHGSAFNRAGEYAAGPAPRSMDRFAVEIIDDVVVIDTGSVTPGSAPGNGTLDEPPRGPSCTDVEG